jgi:hypothetical protein
LYGSLEQQTDGRKKKRKEVKEYFLEKEKRDRTAPLEFEPSQVTIATSN